MKGANGMSNDPKDIIIDRNKIPKQPYKSIPSKDKIKVKPTMITSLMEGDNLVGHENFTHNKNIRTNSNKSKKSE